MARAAAPMLSGLRVETSTTRRLSFTGTIIALKLALIGFGNVGRALARLLESKRREFPFEIVATHTLRHGTTLQGRHYGPCANVEEFLDAAGADVAVELTTLNPVDGEPAIS